MASKRMRIADYLPRVFERRPVLPRPIRLADAKPGDILRDPDGDRWERTEDGGALVYIRGEHGGTPFGPGDIDEAEGNFGPFTLVVP